MTRVISTKPHLEYSHVDYQLRCKDCALDVQDQGPVWCEHIEELMTKNTDAPIMWPPENIMLYTDLDIKIPMFPTQNLWEPVVLEPMENARRYRVGWWPEGTDANITASREPVFLMILNPGESRNIIRSVLLQKMYAEPGWNEKTCDSPAHNFQAEMDWNKTTQEGLPTRWAQHWSVFRYRICLYCNRYAWTGDPDPDLVPKQEGSVW